MQRLTSHFQEYLRRIYATPLPQTTGGVISESQSSSDDIQMETETGSDDDGGRSASGRLKIVIDWGALDVDREIQTISDGKDSDSIIKLLVELISVFGESMEQQLSEFPVIRFPLSKDPTTFLNRAKGKPYPSVRVPGTELYFCSHSDRPQKVKLLRELFSRLTLPDGGDFPSGSVEVSIEV